MSETKFTPGPWEVVSRFVGPLVIVADCPAEIDRSGKIEVAHVGAETFAMAAANAELISAAPELYEALATVMGWIRNWDPEFVQDDEWPDAGNKAKAALAKARGEPS